MTNAHDNETVRAIRQKIGALGYPTTAANYGLRWAYYQGYNTIDEGFALALSRILYSDGQLEDGSRFEV